MTAPFFHFRLDPSGREAADPALQPVLRVYQALERSQWSTAAEIQARQLEGLRALVNHALNHSPYYREKLKKARVSAKDLRHLEDLQKLPLVSRREFQEHGESFLAKKLPPGTFASGSITTSGSSGTPTRVYMTNVSDFAWFGFLLRDTEWCGIDPRGRIATIRSSGKPTASIGHLLEGVTLPHWIPAIETLLPTGLFHGMDVRQDPRRQIKWLHEVKPDYLLSYPSNLDALAALVETAGPLPGLKAIQSISESLSDDVRARVEAAFGVPVRNSYSCAEAGYLASPCPTGTGMHVHSENVILEVLDASGRPVPPGETGQAYLTSLKNFRSPLIRYELGDELSLSPDPCPCGRGLPLLGRLQGKVMPLFHLPGGGRKSSLILSTAVRKLGGHWQHQVVQMAPDHVVVRIATGPAWTPEHEVKLSAILGEFFEGPVRVDLEVVGRIPTAESGKFQSMVLMPQGAG